MRAAIFEFVDVVLAVDKTKGKLFVISIAPEGTDDVRNIAFNEESWKGLIRCIQKKASVVEVDGEEQMSWDNDAT